MLQIQKQNKFLKPKLEQGAGTLPETRKISRTPEQEKVMAESREKRNALASETLERGKKNPAVIRAQAMLAKLGLYNKALDGDFGSGTEAAVREFQAKNNLGVDGKIGVTTALALVRAFQKQAGLTVDGIVGKNTLAALNAPMNIVPTTQVVVKQEKVKTSNNNPFSGFFEGIANIFGGKERIGREFKNLGTQVDASINAASGLGTLEAAIHSIRNTSDKTAIDAVYSQAMQALKGKLPANLYKTLSGADNTMEKAFVLSLVQNALMGGKRAPERIKENNVAEIIAADKRIGAAQDREWSKVGINMSKMRAMAHNLLKTQGSYNQEFYKDNTKTVLWSLRSKHIGGKILNGLQPYSGSAIETVQLQGSTDRIPMKIPETTLKALVDNLDALQLLSIKKNVLKNTGLSDERVKEMILSGTLKYSASYAKSANCFNDAIALTFVPPVRPVRESEGRDGHDGGVSTGPGVEGDVGTDPGVDGGGDVGGGDTGGGNDAGRG